MGRMDTHLEDFVDLFDGIDLWNMWNMGHGR